VHVERGRNAAHILYDAVSTTGIFGHREMPEDLLPGGICRGSLEHLVFITLTVALDYQRDADDLWSSSRNTFEDPRTRYLYDPASLHAAGFSQIAGDMQRYGLSKKPTQDARIWRTVGVSFYKKWKGDPRGFLADCGWDAPTVLERLRTETHPQGKRVVHDYPFLRGAKIGPLWLRMLRDNVGIGDLKGLDQVPIPVDIHVARATLCLGVVRGRFSGQLVDLFEDIRSGWFKSTNGLSAKNRPMIALDVDEPLWHLSKNGCTQRQRDEATGVCPVQERCETRNLCVGGVVRISKNMVEVDT
jgi:hypothetical protein